MTTRDYNYTRKNRLYIKNKFLPNCIRSTQKMTKKYSNFTLPVAHLQICFGSTMYVQKISPLSIKKTLQSKYNFEIMNGVLLIHIYAVRSLRGVK